MGQVESSSSSPGTGEGKGQPGRQGEGGLGTGEGPGLLFWAGREGRHLLGKANGVRRVYVYARARVVCAYVQSCACVCVRWWQGSRPSKGKGKGSVKGAKVAWRRKPRACLSSTRGRAGKGKMQRYGVRLRHRSVCRSCSSIDLAESM